MAFDLPTLPPTQPDWAQFQIWWQQIRDAIQAQEGAQDELITGLQTVTTGLAATIVELEAQGKRLKVGLSWTAPSAVLTATDAGSSATVTIAAHTRVYGDGSQVSIGAGGPFTGLEYDKDYGFYYDDPTTADTSPIFQYTTDLAAAQNNYVDGRHTVGTIHTPTGPGQPPTAGGTTPPGTGGDPRSNSGVVF